MNDPVTLHFFLPSPALRPYVSSIYLTEIAGPADGLVADWLMPEWASLRMAETPACRVALAGEALRPAPLLLASGPTSFATRIESAPIRIWGIGVLPLGWARFVRTDASRFADRHCDGRTEPAFAAIAPVYDEVFGGDPDPARVAERIDAFLLDLLARTPPSPDEDRIRAAHRLLIDEDTGTVTDLAAGLAMPARSLERFCLKAFGFSPKLLLRRQRFTRSIAQFLLDPTLQWIRTLDQHHVDQPHFVRDFQRFMGMSPRAFAAVDHPVLRATARPRASALGGAVQALHRP